MVSKEYQEAKDEVEALANDFYKQHHNRYDGTPEGLQSLKDLWSEFWPEDMAIDEYVTKGVLSPEDADEIERDVFHAVFQRIKGEKADPDAPKYYEPTKKFDVQPHSPYMPEEKTPAERKREIEEAWHLLHGLRNLARTLTRKGFNKEARQVFALLKFAERCPACGTEGAYLGAGTRPWATIECSNPTCQYYSEKWEQEQKGPQEIGLEQEPDFSSILNQQYRDVPEGIQNIAKEVLEHLQANVPSPHKDLKEAYHDFRDDNGWGDYRDAGYHPDAIANAEGIVEEIIFGDQESPKEHLKDGINEVIDGLNINKDSYKRWVRGMIDDDPTFIPDNMTQEEMEESFRHYWYYVVDIIEDELHNQGYGGGDSSETPELLQQAFDELKPEHEKEWYRDQPAQEKPGEDEFERMKRFFFGYAQVLMKRGYTKEAKQMLKILQP